MGGGGLATVCALGQLLSLGGPLQNLLGQLQFGSRVGLVGVLLWQQRQQAPNGSAEQW